METPQDSCSSDLRSVSPLLRGLWASFSFVAGRQGARSSSPHLQAHGILLVFFIRDGLFMSDFYTVFAHTSGLSDF